MIIEPTLPYITWRLIWDLKLKDEIPDFILQILSYVNIRQKTSYLQNIKLKYKERRSKKQID